MIEFLSGSIFDSKAQTLVNPVNRVGVSGAGLAKEFKKRYPDMHRAYARACSQHRMGELLLHRHTGTALPQILCFVTKEHWREPSVLALIEEGLVQFASTRWLRDGTITSVAFPALGCGYGGLAWRDVKPLMIAHLSPIETPVSVYLPKERHHGVD